MTAEGHAIPSPDPNMEAYHIEGDQIIAVSQMGTTLNNSYVSLYNGDLEWFLKRMDEQYRTGSPSSPGQRPGQP
jgi:hypothetical protein